MSTQSGPTPEQPSFGDRMYNATLAFVRALVRLVLILLVAFLIGAAIYLGIPRLYQQYLQPVQDNTTAIQDLYARQDQSAEGLGTRIDSLQERLDSLELQGDQDKQTIAALESELEGLRQLVAAQEEGLSTTSGQVGELDENLSTLDRALKRLESSFESTLASLETEVDANQEDLAALEETFTAAENPLNSLRRELQLVRAMELLTRSRLFLIQNNPGLAAEDLERARDLLASLVEQVPDYQQEALLGIVERLDLTLENIPADLEQAESDLEVAWSLLVEGLPPLPQGQEGDVGSTTSTPEATPEAEVTPTPTPTPAS